MQTISGSADPSFSQPTRHDSAEALAVSGSLMGKATTAYARNEQLLLGRAPQAAVAGGYINPATATPRQAFAAAGADFTVTSRPIAVDVADDSPECDWRTISTHKAIVRTDTDQALGVVGRGYTPAQMEGLINLFEFLREDAVIDNILVLDHGRKVVVSAYIDIVADVAEGHSVRRFLHACNSFDGTTAFSVFFSDMMLRCANQVSYISGKGAAKAKAAGQGLKLRHSAGITEWMKNLPSLIDIQNQTFQQDIAALRPLTTTKLTKEAADFILRNTYAKELSQPIKDKETGNMRERGLDDLETQVGTIRSHYSGNTGIDIIPGTVYGLLQAITQFETWDAGRTKDPIKAARTRLEGLWGGAGSERIEAAREAALLTVQ